MMKKMHRINRSLEVMRTVKLRKLYTHDLARYGKTQERLDLLYATSTILYLAMNNKNQQDEIARLKRKIKRLEKRDGE